MEKLFLHKNWTLTGGKYDSLPASVPGCVHTDLKNNGLLPDYFYRKENENCQWIENEDWTYTTTFDLEKTEGVIKLVFEGLDTYSDVYLNGKNLGETHNMFIPHTFSVSGLLKKTDNVLTVRFRSPIREVAGLEQMNGVFTTERLHTRRIQCTYYWDWVDRFVTCGIFLPVYLLYGDEFRVENTYIYTESVDEYGAQLNLTVNFENYEKESVVKTEIIAPDGKLVFSNERYIREKQSAFRINVVSPLLWYPRGYGNQPLYTLKVTTENEEHIERFGIRTLRVAEIPDEFGGEYYKKSRQLQQNQIATLGKQVDKTEEPAGFIVLVNGVRIYCRGANWVPCEPFPSDESEQKIRSIVDLAAEAGVNMIRVWGGGLFEKNCLYDACDEKGILVTQDFLMACGDYPEKKPEFLEELKKEAEFAAKKLRNHPCLAWWSGDNENAMHGSETDRDHTGRDASLKGLEPTIRALDYARRFHLSSPYSGMPYMSVTRGTTHTTNYFMEMFDYFVNTDCQGYKEHLENFLARFTVEEPIYGFPQKCSLEKFCNETDFSDKTEDVLRFHSKSNPSVKTSLYDYGKNFAQKALGDFSSDDDRLFKYRYIQYEWIRVINENARRNTGYNDGLIYWMLNDCWPASFSWSIIDYYNLPKAAYYSFKRCAKPVISSLKKEDGKLNIYLCSDGSKTGEATVTVKNVDGESLLTFTLSVDGYGVKKKTLELDFDKLNFVICDIEFNGDKDRCFYRDGALPLEKTDGVEILENAGDTITVKATEYIHAVELEGDFVFSDNFFSLLPGEEKTVSFRKNASSIQLTLNAYTLKK